MPHNPPEYGAQIESAGYAKVKDLFAWLHVLQRELPPVFVRAARRLRDKHRRHDPPAQPRRVHARGRTPARDLLHRVGAQLGLRAADRSRVPAHRHRVETDLRPALHGVRRSRRRDGRLPGLGARHQPGAEGHQRQAVPARADSAAVAQALHLRRCACCCSASTSAIAALGLYPLLIAEWHRAAPGHARTRAPSSRGCSRTIATSISPRSRAARGATRPTAFTRRRCDAAGRRHRRVGLHRRAIVVEHLAARGDRGGARCAGRSTPTTAARTRCDGADAVVHLAGVVSALREQDYIAANVDGTRVVAEAARAAGVPMIHISSLAAAGPGAAARRRGPKTIRRRRSTPTAAASSPASARSRWSTACAGPRCARASSMDRAIGRCCRCSSWRGAGCCRWSAAPTRPTPSSTSRDLVRAIAAAVERPAVGDTIFVGHPAAGDDARDPRRDPCRHRARVPRSCRCRWR